MAMNWYIIQAYANFEKKVAESIEREAKRKGLDSYIEKILIPVEKVVEVRRGKKINTERKFFPGYVLIRVDLVDEVFHLIKTTPRVSGFLGSETTPTPISDSEADYIMGKMHEEQQKPVSSVIYEIGESVRVIDGPFVSFTGIVQEVEAERSRLKVEVSIFGRATPVDLDYSQVEKG
ncbi:transcription termination/antitermination protein NusG [Bartonella sp. TP]|uniref:transcription termination/antitermination protein NusG n=1 Tax=Bartonella sp. TP TaxID=3057550 RepID=UPI0025B12797|nr:transcription termination/antitermination protein NusG [Bartonella sp. TP]MDN5248939.1 transcription termination/antitermination protein NusG [Alphaproteobacteria bacterium]WJW79859.1 transcription termination/antitermination protein NusG [Bartonella sp. TP]